MVDQYMNCEDIAMNFLVSHITRKPPLKVPQYSRNYGKPCNLLIFYSTFLLSRLHLGGHSDAPVARIPSPRMTPTSKNVTCV